MNVFKLMPRLARRVSPARIACLLLAMLPMTQARACWEDAARLYGVNPELLYAVAKTESQLNPRAVHRNANGTRDIGLMQINSTWLPVLHKYGIDEQQLLDACTSIYVGAWIMADNMRRMGNSWQAVGAYNAANPVLRASYALKVYKNLPSTALGTPAAQ
nr:lytic transglycosylase domain-containing protein [Janthinobacterium agaricidamnosum]